MGCLDASELSTRMSTDDCHCSQRTSTWKQTTDTHYDSGMSKACTDTCLAILTQEKLKLIAVLRSFRRAPDKPCDGTMPDRRPAPQASISELVFRYHWRQILNAVSLSDLSLYYILFNAPLSPSGDKVSLPSDCEGTSRTEQPVAPEMCERAVRGNGDSNEGNAEAQATTNVISNDDARIADDLEALCHVNTSMSDRKTLEVHEFPWDVNVDPRPLLYSASCWATVNAGGTDDIFAEVVKRLHQRSVHDQDYADSEPLTHRAVRLGFWFVGASGFSALPTLNMERTSISAAAVVDAFLAVEGKQRSLALPGGARNNRASKRSATLPAQIHSRGQAALKTPKLETGEENLTPVGVEDVKHISNEVRKSTPIRSHRSSGRVGGRTEPGKETAAQTKNIELEASTSSAASGSKVDMTISSKTDIGLDVRIAKKPKRMVEPSTPSTTVETPASSPGSCSHTNPSPAHAGRRSGRSDRTGDGRDPAERQGRRSPSVLYSKPTNSRLPTDNISTKDSAEDAKISGCFQRSSSPPRRRSWHNRKWVNPRDVSLVAPYELRGPQVYDSGPVTGSGHELRAPPRRFSRFSDVSSTGSSPRRTSRDECHRWHPSGSPLPPYSPDDRGRPPGSQGSPRSGRYSSSGLDTSHYSQGSRHDRTRNVRFQMGSIDTVGSRSPETCGRHPASRMQRRNY